MMNEAMGRLEVGAGSYATPKLRTVHPDSIKLAKGVAAPEGSLVDTAVADAHHQLDRLSGCIARLEAIADSVFGSGPSDAAPPMGQVPADNKHDALRFVVGRLGHLIDRLDVETDRLARI